MIPALAAQNMLKIFTFPNDYEKDPEGTSLEHIIYMLHEIATEKVKHEKAHRWLGYAQGILVYTERLSLDQCKEINKKA